MRGARAGVRYNVESDDDDAFEDADGDGEDEVIQYIPPMNTRKTPRQNAGQGAERFEEHLFEPAVRRSSHGSNGEAPRRTSGRMKKKIIDPDDEDEEEEEEEEGDQEFIQPKRNAFPSASTRNTRQSTYQNGDGAAAVSVERPSRAKSRHSSADEEEFEPPASDPTEEDDEASDDPIGDDYGTPSGEDDLNSWDDGRRRSSTRVTRSRPKPQPARRSTRNSNRQRDSEDEYGRPKRQLRERTSKINYELPPLDISAELRQDAIANVAGPSRRRGVGFANGTRFGAGTKGFPYSLPQAMGDMDSSDSDMDLMAPAVAAGASGMTGPSAVGAAPGARVGGPADVPNYGRINPKSSEQISAGRIRISLTRVQIWPTPIRLAWT